MKNLFYPKTNFKTKITVMNKIKTNTWILIAIGIVVLIILVKVFSAAKTKRTELKNGYKIETLNSDGTVKSTTYYKTDGTVVTTAEDIAALSA
jgi:hypothetical protein